MILWSYNQPHVVERSKICEWFTVSNTRHVHSASAARLLTRYIRYPLLLDGQEVYMQPVVSLPLTKVHALSTR